MQSRIKIFRPIGDFQAGGGIIPAQSLLTGLMSFYAFESLPGGVDALDSGPSNITLARTGSPNPSLVTGLVGQAVLIGANGTPCTLQTLTAGVNQTINFSGSYTVAFWINLPSGSTPSSTGSTVVTGKYRSNPNQEFALFLASADSGTTWSMNYFIYNTIGTSQKVASTNQSLTGFWQGNWNFIVAQMDIIANTFSIQINNGTPVSATRTLVVIGGADNFYLGNPDTSYSAGIQFDQYGFWNRVLSASELTQVYNGGAGLAYSQLSTYA